MFRGQRKLMNFIFKYKKSEFMTKTESKSDIYDQWVYQNKRQTAFYEETIQMNQNRNQLKSQWFWHFWPHDSC